MSNRWQEKAKICLEGHLLVASPNWNHNFFGHSVCLVVHHSPQGAVGVFLNRNLGTPSPGLWEKLGGTSDVNKQAAINFGGPQSGPVVALHGRPELAEFAPAEGVYFAAQIQNLQKLIATTSDDSPVKIIVGQSDWQSGILDQEFAEGKWLPLPVMPSIVFADENKMWSTALREIGNRFVMEIAGVGAAPTNILHN